MKRKILIVCNAFYPDINPRSFRATELAKEFAIQGHKVVVYTIFRNFYYKPFEEEFNIDVRTFKKLKLPVIYNKKNKIIFYLSRFLNKVLNILFYYPFIEFAWRIPQALRNIKGYDLMISIAFPHSVHWGCANLIRKNRRPANIWVADSGDPFMGNTLEIKRLFYFKYIEKWFCKKADFLSVPIKGATQAYYPEFRKKIIVIPQGYKFEKLGITNNVNKAPTFLYAGLFIPGSRDPRPFIEYLIQSKKEFKFIIYTNQISLVEKYLNLSDNKIEVYNYIPRNELLIQMMKVDFLVNFDNNVGEMVPSKLIDYGMTGKPILNIKKELDFKMINKFLIGDYSNQYKIDDLEKYKIEKVAKQFIDLIPKSDNG